MMNSELNTLFICAFRYALGRKTYVTSEISDLLCDKMYEMTLATKQLIKREIERAFETNDYGMEMDKVEWQRLLEVLNTDLGVTNESK